MSEYDSLSTWANAVQEQCCACAGSFVVSILQDYDLTTAEGVRNLSTRVISELRNNAHLEAQDAKNLWQVGQCLKKFRYGCTASPEEMQERWIERNKLCASSTPSSALWVLDEMRALLKPLASAFEATDSISGRFGNGAVAEGLSSIARWNRARGFCYDLRDPDDIRWWKNSSNSTARLHCVPKDMFKLRSITIEPAEATFLQQRTRSRLIAASAKVLPNSSAIPQQLYGAGPEIQQMRALRGSLTGRTATLDLSDASDSIRWDHVIRVFPPNIVAELERARSTYVEVGGTRYRANMFAGMGNATTFIVESLFFWALCTVLSRWLRDFTPVSVFGDDIVLATRVANHPLFNHYMALLGLTVNMEKSGTSDGPGFREACGLVAYQGEELPLHRIQGYANEPEGLVSLCSWVTDALRPDSRFVPFIREVGRVMGQKVISDFHFPLLPWPLVTAGLYVSDPSESIGPWSYRARWDPEAQHIRVKTKVLHAICNRIRVGSLRTYERLGVLNGQLQTDFTTLPFGCKANRQDVLLAPTHDVELVSKWVTAWGSDASDLELVEKS